MSGGSSQSASQPSDASFLNPAGGVLSNLFGVGTNISKFGGIGQFGPIGSEVPRKNQGSDPISFANQAFGPGSFESIADLLNPNQNLGAGNAFNALTNSGELFSQIDQLISGQFLPALSEGLETGFRTDIDPIREQAEREFRRSTVPQIQEQFAAQTGSFATDFLGSVTGAAGDIHTNLGALQSQLDEAASGRRTALLGQGAGLAQQAGQVGLNLAGSSLNLGEQLILDSTQGGRAATVLQMLAGLQPTSAIPRGNISTSASKSGGA